MNIREFMDNVPMGEKGITIQKIAKSAGVAPSTVRHWICGLRNPKPENLPAISQVTGLSFQELRPDIYNLLKETA